MNKENNYTKYLIIWIIHNKLHSYIKFTTNNGKYLTQTFNASTDETDTVVYRVSREECARLWENVPYVKVHRSNPKQLHPKLNGYGDNGQRKV